VSLPQSDLVALKTKALLYRREILQLIHRAGCGHPGGSLSAVEILTALYSYKMKHDPTNPAWSQRDRLIISKGHISPAAYVLLADQGYFPRSELERYRTYGSRLQGHVVTEVPGIEFNTGSLGHGLSVANGMAAAARLNSASHRIFCLMGDGEIQEGSVWEAAMSSAHHRFSNLCAIIDYNKVQECALTNEVMNLEPLAEKWRAFGWFAVEIMGHDFLQLIAALDQFDTVTDKPFVIIAHTVKGKGVSFMEMNRNWHGKAPNDEQLAKALDELRQSDSRE
jgi:transketolase